MFAYCNNNPINNSDQNGEWPKWAKGAANIIGGVLQAAAGAALIATTGWSGIGAAVGAFLIINGAATVTQGIGQVVNDVGQAEMLREDNMIKTATQNIGASVGGEAGSAIAGGIYDGAVAGATLYAGNSIFNSIDEYMPKIVKSKLFSANDGYGIKIGNSIEMFYQNPNASGGPGGTIFSYKGILGKFRIDWDPTYGFHSHPPGH